MESAMMLPQFSTGLTSRVELFLKFDPPIVRARKSAGLKLEVPAMP
jgi:hypothetical protein